MSARAICRTLSTKGIHVDYRPAAHHALFELDSVFDFKYSALHWCNSIVDEHFKTTLWKQHKNFVLELCEGIQDISQSDIIDDKIRVTFIATGNKFAKFLAVPAPVTYYQSLFRQDLVTRTEINLLRILFPNWKWDGPP